MTAILSLIKQEEQRQQNTLMLIPSENYTYPEVREAVGSVLMHKYSEGYPGKRYYQGNEFIDQIELLCQESALSLFDLNKEEWGVNVQALSGTPANLAILNALAQPSDQLLSMYLYDGGHLSHGWSYKDKKITLSSKIWNTNFYYVDPETGKFDYEKIEKQAREVKPKVVISGGTAYAPEIDHERLASIAHEVGAYYLADVSHEAGLIAAGVNKSPFDFADVVMMTTHKTLRGPRGALIFSKKELSPLIDASVFPGTQGGPHNHTIAGIAIALQNAKTPEFKTYAKQTVANAKALAKSLKDKGFTIVSGGTDKHLILIDLRSKGITGWHAAWALEAAGIITNRSTIPGDPASPYYPSGLRIGTPAITVRGMTEKQMEQIADYISQVIDQVGAREIPSVPETRKEKLKAFKEEVFADPKLTVIQKNVEELCAEYPIEF